MLPFAPGNDELLTYAWQSGICN